MMEIGPSCPDLCLFLSKGQRPWNKNVLKMSEHNQSVSISRASVTRQFSLADLGHMDFHYPLFFPVGRVDVSMPLLLRHCWGHVVCRNRCLALGRPGSLFNLYEYVPPIVWKPWNVTYPFMINFNNVVNDIMDSNLISNPVAAFWVLKGDSVNRYR